VFETNPVEKYVGQIGSFPPRIGVESKTYLKPTPIDSTLQKSLQKIYLILAQMLHLVK